jgi:hypothetical protein
MPEEHRTFKVTQPLMQGGDVKRWQRILNAQEKWGKAKLALAVFNLTHHPFGTGDRAQRRPSALGVALSPWTMPVSSGQTRLEPRRVQPI